jgi:phosphoribosylglycinamide formyltransferase-1
MSESLQLKVVVLISGSGTNLQAIIDSMNAGLPIRIAAVISNRADAYGLERAFNVGIETAVLSHKDFADRSSYDQALTALIDRFSPDLVVLAGFMRILTESMVHHYIGRMLNIHPSLLPKFTGLHTHQRALDAGEHLHGTTIHFVTEALDSGPLIAQAQVTVLPQEDAESLASRVLKKEHQLYPLVIRWYAEKRLRLNEYGEVILDNQKLLQPVVYEPQDPIR